MSKKVHGSDDFRWVDFSIRRVYRVKLRDNAYDLWVEEFGDPDPDHADKSFFDKYAGKEIDVYPWDRNPTEDTTFFEVEDDNICLVQSMFESASPALPFVGDTP